MGKHIYIIFKCVDTPTTHILPPPPLFFFFSDPASAEHPLEYVVVGSLGDFPVADGEKSVFAVGKTKLPDPERGDQVTKTSMLSYIRNLMYTYSTHWLNSSVHG